VTSSPSSVIVPEVGSMSRLTIFRVVDFPQPEGPTARRAPAGDVEVQRLDGHGAVGKRLADALEPDHRGLRYGPSRDLSGGRTDASCLIDNAWICAEYLRTRQGELVDATEHHLIITVASVALGLVVALPLRCSHDAIEGRGGGPRHSTGLYTVPVPRLVLAAAPFTGLGKGHGHHRDGSVLPDDPGAELIAGLDGVPTDVVEAARGMGYGAARMLVRVALPLGVARDHGRGTGWRRFSTVALTTVGAIVGAGGLGTLLYEAFPSQFKAQILAASVLCVLLAVVLDVALLGAQRLMTPWAADRSRNR
jgi:osmoprotectant transport system permease protein